jgi:integrase
VTLPIADRREELAADELNRAPHGDVPRGGVVREHEDVPDFVDEPAAQQSREIARRRRVEPENNARQGFADAKQIAALCRHLADAVQFMFITGWRSRSEVLPLRWPQVDLAGGFVRLEPGTTKNGEGRAFPLIPELHALLEHRQAITRRCERAQGRIIAHVFHRYGKPIKSLRRAWRTASKDAGRPGLLLHDLRRSAVRNLERAGISRSVTMKLTGHKTEAVYRRYAIVAESDLREAGTKLAATLGTASARLRSIFSVTIR